MYKPAELAVTASLRCIREQKELASLLDKQNGPARSAAERTPIKTTRPIEARQIRFEYIKGSGQDVSS
jgi:hypothetical protein